MIKRFKRTNMFYVTVPSWNKDMFIWSVVLYLYQYPVYTVTKTEKWPQYRDNKTKKQGYRLYNLLKTFTKVF